MFRRFSYRTSIYHAFKSYQLPDNNLLPADFIEGIIEFKYPYFSKNIYNAGAFIIDISEYTKINSEYIYILNNDWTRDKRIYKISDKIPLPEKNNILLFTSYDPETNAIGFKRFFTVSYMEPKGDFFYPEEDVVNYIDNYFDIDKIIEPKDFVEIDLLYPDTGDLRYYSFSAILNLLKTDSRYLTDKLNDKQKRILNTLINKSSFYYIKPTWRSNDIEHFTAQLNVSKEELVDTLSEFFKELFR